MIQISKKIGAAVKAQRSLQATHRFHIAFSNPPVVSHQAGIRRRTPTVEAFSIQGYDQPSRQTSTVNMLTMSSADPERYRPVGLMGDDPAATRVLYPGRSWDSFPRQPEGIQRTTYDDGFGPMPQVPTGTLVGVIMYRRAIS